MAEVTMSLEEYLALLERQGIIAPGSKDRAPGPQSLKRKAKIRVGKKDPKMARALRKANAMGRKKSGGFKKGWSQAKIMKKAHQIRRRGK